MAKKKAEVWDDAAIDEYMDAQRAARAVKAGYMNAAEVTASDIGLHLPHLCLRYLFQRTTYPLERVTILFGPPKGNKSTLLFWFYKLFYNNKGRYLHLETEDKDASLLRLAMTDYDMKAGDGRACESMDTFQAELNNYIDWYKSVCEKGPGRRRPYIIGVDSLTAKMTEDAQKVMDKNDGVATRRFADEARSLSDWFKDIPRKLQGWPLGLIAVNHDKPKPGHMPGQVIHHTPGGSAPTYYATYRILVVKIKSLPPNAANWQVNRIKLSTESSSLGADRKAIEVELSFRVSGQKNSDNEALRAQEVTWNWDKATTELLLKLAVDGKGGPGNAVRDLVGISRVSGGYAAPSLGVKSSEPLSATAMGQLIEKSPELLEQLETALGIHQSRCFSLELPFDEQLAIAKKEAYKLIPVFEKASEIPDGEDGEENEEGSGDE